MDKNVISFRPAVFALLPSFRLILPPFMLGFMALSFQILLMREFNVHFAGNELSFGIILGFWLFWTGIGSLAAPRFRYSEKRLERLYILAVLLFPVCLALLRSSRLILGTLPGEIHGMGIMLLFALILSFILCVPLGFLFVYITRFSKGRLSHVYLWESAGSAVGGLAVYFVFIPLLSNWKSGAAAGLLAMVTFTAAMKNGKKAGIFGVIIVLSAFWIYDLPSQKIYWNPFRLLESRDSPYGRLQVLETSEQISLYQNHSPVYFYPDAASAEETVHFPLLYRPDASRILLIGGGMGGALREILKYPRTEVDYIEIDSSVIQLSLKYLPREESSILKNQRVHIKYRDGREFIRGKSREYDVILLNIPPPFNAQWNRYYTREFFLEAQKSLTAAGILSFTVPSSENVISPSQKKVLESLYRTADSVFSSVRVVPGNTNIFIASRNLNPLDGKIFQKTLREYELETQYMQSTFIKTRLSPLKVSRLRQQIASSHARINRDFHPISYFYHAVFQSQRTGDIEADLYTWLSSHSSRFWLLDVPLIILILAFLLLGTRKSRSPFYLFPLALMGLTVIMTEIILIIAFQSLSGYLYQTAAFLFAAYMGGLTLGAFMGKSRRRARIEHMMVIQFFLILLLSVSQWLITQRLSGFIIAGLLVFLGILGGDMFIVSNRLFLEEKINYGAGYGLDLLGSFLGALFVSSLLIPLVGLTVCLTYLFLAGSFCLLFLFWGYRRFPS